MSSVKKPMSALTLHLTLSFNRLDAMPDIAPEDKCPAVYPWKHNRLPAKFTLLFIISSTKRGFTILTPKEAFVSEYSSTIPS